ncbi:M14 family zinc carboxypeptidase [candidate division KSB1 bacterium]
MKHNRLVLSLFIVFVLVFFACSQSEFKVSDVNPTSVPTPESVIGFKPGTDYKMANWEQIYSYFHELDKASDRIEVEEVGETEMGNPMIVALISSPENLKNKEKFKEYQRKLADPRLSTPQEMAKIVEEAPAVVLMSFSLHATELGATQMSSILGYQLATGNDYIVKQILDNVIFVLFPSANPDGVQLESDHYMGQNPGPGVNVTGLPRIYNKYTGHDNNRDWYMITQKESNIIAKQMYEEWFPEIIFDMHQMGNSGARFFLPPFADPVNPLIHPQIVRGLQLIGGYFNTDLIAGGYPWVENQSRFTMWWHGGMRTAPYYHNMIGILSETASAGLASPIIPTDAEIESIRNRPKPEATINYPVPWIGDRPWTIGDIVEQDRIAALALLKAAARNRDTFVKNFYTMNKETIEKGKNEKPFAYILPADQHDKGAMVYFAETMLKQDTDFFIAKEEFTAEGKTYPEGSLILYLSQPGRQNILGLMMPQNYPDNRRPYDITGWTLPMQMGVEYDKIDEEFTVNADPYTIAEPVIEGITSAEAKTFYIGANSVDHFKAVNRLFKNGYSLSMSTEEVSVDGFDLPPGSIILNDQGNLSNDLENMKKEMSLKIVGTASTDKPGNVELTKPRIGLVDDPRSMPVGWMRWLLEKHEFDYELVNMQNFERAGLNNDFDVLLFITLPRQQGGRGGRGGQAQQGNPAQAVIQQALKSFVSGGGSVVAWSNTVNQISQILGLRIRNATPAREVFSVPGSVLRINVDTSHPVTYGMQENTSIFFRNNNILRADQGRILGRFPATNPLVSGFIMGSEAITNTPAIVYEEAGNGKVTLISFEPVFRAQPVASFKIVFNSILNSVVK